MIKGNDEEGKPKAKFNAALAKLERIDILRRGCHDAKILKDYEKWNGCLVGYRGELNSRMSKEEGGHRDKADRVEEEINNTLYGNLDKKGLNELFKLMQDYELWLADLEKEFGLDMPDKADGLEATSG